MAGDHYLQAALMGRWGRPRNKALRYWPICARLKESATAFEPTTPDAVAKQNNLYPAWLDKIWQSYERELPRVIADLERGQVTKADASFLLLHVAALKPRSTTFLEDLNEYEQQHGLPLTVDGASLSMQRILSMLATAQYAITWRWRVLRPPAGEYFILNDRGLCEFSDVDPRTGLKWPGRGIFFPLGPTIGVLGFLHEEELHKSTYVFRSLDFSQRYTLNRGYTAFLNLRLWKDANRLVIGQYH